jgi:hypothetical protein
MLPASTKGPDIISQHADCLHCILVVLIRFFRAAGLWRLDNDVK